MANNDSGYPSHNSIQAIHIYGLNAPGKAHPYGFRIAVNFTNAPGWGTVLDAGEDGIPPPFVIPNPEDTAPDFEISVKVIRKDTE